MDSTACGGSSIGFQKAQKASVETLWWVGWVQETNAVWLQTNHHLQMTLRPISHIPLIWYSFHLEKICIVCVIELEPRVFDTWFELSTGKYMGVKLSHYGPVGMILSNPNQIYSGQSILSYSDVRTLLSPSRVGPEVLVILWTPWIAWRKM